MMFCDENFHDSLLSTLTTRKHEEFSLLKSVYNYSILYNMYQVVVEHHCLTHHNIIMLCVLLTELFFYYQSRSYVFLKTFITHGTQLLYVLLKYMHYVAFHDQN